MPNHEYVTMKMEALEERILVTERKCNKMHKELDTKIEELEHSTAILKNPPWTFVCAYKYLVEYSSRVIDYDKILYSSTNVDGADLDLASGVFTSGHPGTYTAVWTSENNNAVYEKTLNIFLRKNGDIIVESEVRMQVPLHWPFWSSK